MPARRGAWAIYEVFPTADGELFLGVTSDQQWARFVEEFGLQQLAADPRLATNLMRCHERSWLIPALTVVVAKLPSVGFPFTTDQLFWLAALPGIAGQILHAPALQRFGELLRENVAAR